MIVNQLKNKSFRTTAEYVLEKEKAELLDTNMLGATPRQMSREVAAIRRRRPNLQHATLHVIFALPYRNDEEGNAVERENLADEQAIELVTKWREAMLVTNCLYFLARHSDKTHNHFHLVACRIRMDGSVVDDSWDYRRSEVVVRQLEKEFGLSATPCSNGRVAEKVEEKGISITIADRRAQTRKQKHHLSGKPPVKQQLAALIDEATASHPTVTELIGRLQRSGVTVHPQFSTLGLFKEALAFELDGVKVAGNKIGSAYSFPGLVRKRGVQYEPERDMRALLAARTGEVVQLHETFSEPLAESTQPPPQQQEKELPPIEVPTACLSANHPIDEVDEAEFSTNIDKKHIELTLPVVEQSKDVRQQVADENYLTLWLIFQRAKVLGKATEIAPGRWTYQDKGYGFGYNESEELFTLAHIERGLLARYQSRKLLAVGKIEPSDIEAFANYESSRTEPTSTQSHLQRGKSQFER